MERYFALSYRGLPMADLTIHDDQGMSVELYRCRLCSALTDMPIAHGDWHENPEETR